MIMKFYGIVSSCLAHKRMYQHYFQISLFPYECKVSFSTFKRYPHWRNSLCNTADKSTHRIVQMELVKFLNCHTLLHTLRSKEMLQEKMLSFQLTTLSFLMHSSVRCFRTHIMFAISVKNYFYYVCGTCILSSFSLCYVWHCKCVAAFW